MSFNISVTSENTKSFPIHSHRSWELMCYTHGEGNLHTQNGDYPFKSGTVIAIPPGISHGSEATDTFVNICIHTDLTMLSKNDTIYLPEGTSAQRQLFEIIRSLYFSPENYDHSITSLIMALGGLLENSSNHDHVNRKIIHIREEIESSFTNPEFNIYNLIQSSGYADDYLRSIFLKHYGLTPKGYLNKLRMEYAKSLINTYQKALKISDIACQCGFSDPLYFSRRFKKYFDVSPINYIKGDSENGKN